MNKINAKIIKKHMYASRTLSKFILDKQFEFKALQALREPNDKNKNLHQSHKVDYTYFGFQKTFDCGTHKRLLQICENTESEAEHWTGWTTFYETVSR